MSSQTTIIPVKNLMDKDPVIDRIFIVKDKNIGTGKTYILYIFIFMNEQI